MIHPQLRDRVKNVKIDAIFSFIKENQIRL